MTVTGKRNCFLSFCATTLSAFAMLTLPNSLSAQWGGWESLGGIILEQPDCVSWGPDRIDCFARGTDAPCGTAGGMATPGAAGKASAVSSWSSPNASAGAPNRIDCFARGTDRAMYHRWWDGSAWGGWESLGGIILEQPSCVSWGPDRIDCFARGTDRAMWHRWWDGNAWGGWENLGRYRPGAAELRQLGCRTGSTASPVAPTSRCGTAGGMAAPGVAGKAWAASSWSSRTASAGASNRIDCFARGTDLAMWHRWWDGSAWGGWENLGGIILEQPECVSWGTDRLDCFARGADQALWHRWWDGTAWGGWETLGGVILEEPSCLTWGPDRIDCFARGTDAAMWTDPI